VIPHRNVGDGDASVRDDDERMLYLGLGPLVAIALGAALMPVREVVMTSTLVFPYIILTMIAAELGGQLAALGTAITSVLSMDFFLMKPYLRLAIEAKHDVTTLLGLAACGVVAAALSTRRKRRAS
jgi:K+-sensing histidine kinase KdpD